MSEYIQPEKIKKKKNQNDRMISSDTNWNKFGENYATYIDEWDASLSVCVCATVR